MPPPEASYWPPALAWSYKAPKITQLYLSCLVAGVLKLTRSHGHQNYGPQLLGWSQGVKQAPQTWAQCPRGDGELGELEEEAGGQGGTVIPP